MQMKRNPNVTCYSMVVIRGSLGSVRCVSTDRDSTSLTEPGVYAM